MRMDLSPTGQVPLAAGAVPFGVSATVPRMSAGRAVKGYADTPAQWPVANRADRPSPNATVMDETTILISEPLPDAHLRQHGHNRQSAGFIHASGKILSPGHKKISRWPVNKAGSTRVL